jgi:signal transduction histidine kinase
VPVLTVLVIDDNELSLRVARTLLERAGHRVMNAGSAAETADMLAAAAAGVVLLSAALPDEERQLAMNAVLAPRKSDAGAPVPPPVVVVAASPEQRGFAESLVSRGAAGVVARPYDRERLAAHVELYALGAAPARVLVVDDSPTLRHANSATLVAAGHEVLEATDGHDALEVLAAHPEIDLVLTDVVMPNLDGYQLVQAIRARPGGDRLPVVMLTSLDDVGSQSRAIEVGADDVLTKPIQPAELRARVRSILRLKTLQQRLQERNHELRRAMQLREDLTQTIVHDFKNPLSVVMGCADMIAWQAEEEELGSIKDLADDIVNASIRLKAFTDNLLHVARMEGDSLRPRLSIFPIAEVGLSICTDIGRLARRHGLELTCTMSPELRVHADRDWIYRVLQNLVDNAIKYAPQSSVVSLTARPHGERQVLVEVADQGPGIPAEHRSHIFEKFAQLKGSERRGSGLGLTFCRMVIEAHGGWIRVEDVPGGGKGAVFAFTLPAG